MDNPTYSAAELAELLDCRDLSGVPAAHVVLQWAAEGNIPAPDIQRPDGGAHWYKKTIDDFLGRLSGKAAPEPLLVSGKQLAAIIGMSTRWVSAHRHRIIGAQKVGGCWRYNLDVIRQLISSGKDIVSAPAKIPKSFGRKN